MDIFGLYRIASGRKKKHPMTLDSLFAYGTNTNARFGTGNTDNLSDITALSNEKWKDIVLGEYFSFFLKHDNTMWGCGRNNAYDLGLNDLDDRVVPTQIGNENTWAQISLGCALKFDGTIWAWGRNMSGVCGLGHTDMVPLPTRIGDETDWKKILSNGSQTFALKKDGRLFGCGNNINGQLSIYNYGSNVLNLTQIRGDWKDISISRYSSAGIQNDGTLWLIGAGVNSNIIALKYGHGLSYPEQFGIESDWDQVFFFDHFAYLLKNDHSAWLVGARNGVGGLGMTNYTLIPEVLEDNFGWKFFSEYKLGLKTDGTLWAMDGNILQSFGFAGNTDSTIPVQIGEETAWNKISAQYQSFLALKQTV